jgi:outer membrane protein TolC
MRIALITLFLISFPAVASAETVTLDQVIKNSLQKNTSIYQVERDYEDKLADAVEAKQLDNPELNADLIRSRGNGDIGADFELTQPLKLSQISGSRALYADLLGDVAGTEQQYEVLKVINETTVLYTQVWLLQERKRLYETYADDADKMKKLVNASAGQGQTSPAAAHLFSSDAAKLRADARAVEAELRQTRTELSRKTGRTYQTVELSQPIFSTIPQAPEQLQKFAETRSNLRNVVKNRLKAAEQRLNVAEEDGDFSEIGPRVLYSRATDGGEDAYGLGVALRIPLWNHNDAERNRARAEVKQARAETDVFNQLPQQDLIAELGLSASAMQERTTSYFDEILPGYRKSYELTRSMFRQGQASALEVWQVREKLLGSENEALDAVAEVVNARGALEIELGGKLEEIQ